MAIAVFTSLDQQFDNSGDPLNGGTITVYQAGTTTPISLFSDTALSVPATNPITLDSAGRHAITYFATQAYKVLVKDSGGSTIFTRDNIDPGVPVGTGALPIANGGTGATSAATALSNLGGATAAELADVAADVAALAGAAASTEKTHIATGTTAQRPAVPADGDIRRNTTVPQFEFYGSTWEKVFTDVSFTASTQAEQETGSSLTTFVSPGRQQFHDSAAKYWIVCAADGTTQDSYNVTSITDSGTGVLDITIATDFSGANYATVSTARSGSSHLTIVDNGTPPTAGTTRILNVSSTAGTAADPARYHVASFGDQ